MEGLEFCTVGQSVFHVIGLPVFLVVELACRCVCSTLDSVVVVQLTRTSPAPSLWSTPASDGGLTASRSWHGANIESTNSSWSLGVMYPDSG